MVVVSGRESKRVPWTNKSYRQTTVFILSWCFQAKEDLIGISSRYRSNKVRTLPRICILLNWIMHYNVPGSWSFSNTDLNEYSRLQSLSMCRSSLASE